MKSQNLRFKNLAVNANESFFGYQYNKIELFFLPLEDPAKTNKVRGSCILIDINTFYRIIVLLRRIILVTCFIRPIIRLCRAGHKEDVRADKIVPPLRYIRVKLHGARRP